MPVWHTRNHGNATACFERIANARKAVGLDEPLTSAKDGGQITLNHRFKPTAFVGLRTRQPPWYVQWDKERSRGRPREHFPDCDAPCTF